MNLFASLDAKDRKLLLICIASVLVLAVLTGLFARNQNNDDNPLPGTYLTGKHGARAAYDLLQSSGYSIERWEQPLSDLAAQASPHTVVILAEPYLSGVDDFKAIHQIVERGGRVLATGINGGQLLPEGAVAGSTQFRAAACKLSPEGLDPLADSGQVWMVPEASWKVSSPRYRVQYNCAGEPAVVEYDQGPGHIVWWASSTPLENGTIGRDANLDMFLNALGTRSGHSFYWDESLHGDVHSEWFYARGPAMNMLIVGLAALSALVVFSFSRRRGPVRDLTSTQRATPREFLEALGSLYAKARSTSTAVGLAYERFKRNMGALCGMNGMQMTAQQLSEALRRRFPQAGKDLEADMAACEAAMTDDKLLPKRALALVQALDAHGEMLRSAAAGKSA